MYLYIISHYFTPYAGVGARRIEYFTRYLLDKGYRITLFKADNKYYKEQTNDQFNHEDLTVVNVIPSSENDHYWAKAYLSKIMDSMKSSGKPDLMLFSAGPYFYLKLSSIIKRKFDIPYIIGFRDTYLNTKGFYEKHKKFSLKRFIRFVILRFFDANKSAILHADYITTVTNAEKQNLIRHYGKSIRNKIVVVRNGFDDNLLGSIKKIEPLPAEGIKTCKLGIFGKFGYYSTQDVHAFMSAITTVKEEYPVSVYLVGKKEPQFNQFLQNKNQAVPLIQTGFLSYKEGLQILSCCDILILNNRSSNALGTKIFDYIALNKPIIAFTKPESEISNLLQPFENAYIVGDETECRNAIKTIIQHKVTYLNNDIDLYKYSRLSQTIIFEELIKSLLQQN